MAAVASRNANNSPRLSSKMTSPQDAKKSLPVKAEEEQRKDSPVTNNTETSPTSPQSDKQKVPSQPEDVKPVVEVSSSTNTTQPLAPPPKPSQTSNAEGGNDYFNTVHNNTNFNLEPNPFEQSFGSNPADAPGKTLLPSVASLTSPSSLLPGGTPNWTNSLRSGPLSPAMLAGPTGAADYFGDSHFRGGFPTPNESSLRTGLTPGGGGSMFPAQSPNSQALFNSLQSGGATPSTLDFQRTAMSAAAKANKPNSSLASNIQTAQSGETTEGKTTQNQGDPYHDANDAANGLFMLAQANGARNNSTSKDINNTNKSTQFAVPVPSAQAVQTNTTSAMGQASQDTSPTSQRGRNSVTSIGQAASGEVSDSGHSEPSKPATRARGKKGGKAANNRRKADETPSKAPAAKKMKMAPPLDIPDMDEFSDDDDDDVSPKMEGMDTRKMTDEEKRKNFLERNRVAALKCRQRKKQWLQSLQAKVEYYSTENESLNQQVASLREEILNLKTIMIAHKDCPITQQQGLSGMALANLLGDFPGHHGHPYGMGMQNGMQNGLPPQGFSMPQAPAAPMHRS